SLRRWGLIAVGFCALTLTVTSATQIIRAVLFPPSEGPPISCRDGVTELYEATQRAVSHAGQQIDGERAALAEFRRSVEPAWSHYGTIARACRGDARGEAALRSVELLRYAEERAVRYEALDLSRLRRATPAALAALPPSVPAHP
ncbi:MAG TPA: hypothetical protein VLC09_16950, partial [Polyangiaceae bacterium]|nr:hypothetical protein [Polyangiaceae bacterium]